MINDVLIPPTMAGRGVNRKDAPLTVNTEVIVAPRVRGLVPIARMLHPRLGDGTQAAPPPPPPPSGADPMTDPNAVGSDGSLWTPPFARKQ